MKTFLAPLCLLTLTLPAAAWNKPGHMATGAVAYHDLKTNSGLLEKLVAVLREHPDYAAKWKPQVDEGAAANIPEAEVLLMLAARWPDDSEDGHKGQKGEWHYINTPLAFDGSPTKPAKPNNLVSSFAERVTDFKSAPDNAEGKIQKAIALCWILHQLGDAHQPLHAVSLFSSRFQGNAGDLGGNIFYVRYSEGGATQKLHFVWDEAITSSYNLRQLNQLAITLRAENPRTKFENVAEQKPQKWIEESAALAKSVVYQNGALQSGPNKNDGIVLPPGYSQERGRVGKQRGTLAGYRMADWLKANL